LTFAAQVQTDLHPVVGEARGRAKASHPLLQSRSLTHTPPRLALENVQEEDGQPCGAF